MENKKVVGYIRVSSEEQTKGFSLDSQRKRIEEFVQFKKWNINKFYQDEGVSGTSIKKRKSFQDMIRDAKNGKFSVIVVTKFDRAFRNVVDALTTIDELHKLNIDFVSIAEDIDTTTPMGRALFTIVSVFAELESKRNSERVRDVRLMRFEKGIMVGKAPIGYKLHPKKKIMVIDEKKAQKVREIFQRTANGESYKKICEDLKINPQSYYNILKNKVYIGIICFEDVEKKGIHQQIISEELFNKVNKNSL